jgi:hypothetical protein
MHYCPSAKNYILDKYDKDTKMYQSMENDLIYSQSTIEYDSNVLIKVRLESLAASLAYFVTPPNLFISLTKSNHHIEFPLCLIQ